MVVDCICLTTIINTCMAIERYNKIHIISSIFINNTIGGIDGGGLYIHSTSHSNIAVTGSVFANNTVNHSGGGLTMDFLNDTHNSVIITSSIFHSNIIGRQGGGLSILCTSGTHNHIAANDSLFSHNIINSTGGGLYIYSSNACNNVTINTSTFDDNNIISRGGLSIYSEIGTHNTIIVMNSAFINNDIIDGGGLLVQSECSTHCHIAIVANQFNNNNIANNGSGLIIYSNSITHNIISVASSTFTDNHIGNIGGGLVLYSKINAHNIITITNCIFNNNTVCYGSGLHIYSEKKTYHNISITGSEFTGNKNGCGGQIIMPWIGDDSTISIRNSTFCNNDVAGLSIHVCSNVFTYITNSVVANTNGSGLVIRNDLSSNLELQLSQLTVANNNDSGIFVIGHCTVIFTNGHSIIVNNRAHYDGTGGGMYLDYTSYLTTKSGGHVSFINNTALYYGGAIYSANNGRNAYYRLTWYYASINQCTIYNLSATFINNSALAGDVLYGGEFIQCAKVIDYYLAGIEKTTAFKNIMYKCLTVPAAITNSTSIHPLSTVSSDPLFVCPCVNGIVNCSTTSLDREVYPGQTVQVSVVTVGLCRGISPGFINIWPDSKINVILLSTSNLYTFNFCTEVSFTTKVTNYTSSAAVGIYAANNDIEGELGYIDVHLTILPCPLGLVLEPSIGGCICSSDLIHIPEVKCNISWAPYPIQRSKKYWISHDHQYKCTVVHTRCPFDYCSMKSVKLRLNESDLQCNYNRSGILCGQCKEGLSLMIGSNRCANCTDTTLVSMSIFIIATVAGIMLVIFLIALNLTVAVGSINGLLFYT